MSSNSNASPSFPLISHPNNQAHHYSNDSEQQNSLNSPEGNRFIIQIIIISNISNSLKNFISQVSAYRFK